MKTHHNLEFIIFYLKNVQYLVLSLKLVDRHFDLHYLSLKNDFSLYSKIINALSILSEKKITGMKL